MKDATRQFLVRIGVGRAWLSLPVWRFAKELSKTVKGLSGSTTTQGTRTFPFSLLPLDLAEDDDVSPKEKLSGVLDSHEIQGSAPLLLSLHAQAQLGMVKDLYNGACSGVPSDPRKALEIRLFRTSDSGLLCINLTDWLRREAAPSRTSYRYSLSRCR